MKPDCVTSNQSRRPTSLVNFVRRIHRAAPRIVLLKYGCPGGKTGNILCPVSSKSGGTRVRKLGDDNDQRGAEWGGNGRTERIRSWVLRLASGAGGVFRRDGRVRLAVRLHLRG